MKEENSVKNITHGLAKERESEGYWLEWGIRARTNENIRGRKGKQGGLNFA